MPEKRSDVTAAAFFEAESTDVQHVRAHEVQSIAQ
jgi:hypothetical protein